MDNLSHTVAGLLIGEIVSRALPDRVKGADVEAALRTRRALLLTASTIANNFPDLDMLYSRILPPPLGYLLHHRGHTHTLFLAIPQSILLLGVLLGLWPAARRLVRADAIARNALIALTLGGFFLHVFFDSLNSYGVHPFAPFVNRWYYGDVVFIAEPYFWIAFGVTFSMTIRRSWVRAAMITVLLSIPTAFCIAGYLALPTLFVLDLAAILIVAAQLKFPTGNRGNAVGLAIWAAFIVAQVYFGNEGRMQVTEALEFNLPGESVLDVAMTPLPAQPLCWNFVGLTRGDGGVYRVRSGRIAVRPGLVTLEGCRWLDRAIPLKREDGIAWTGAENGNVREIQLLASANCSFDAWLRFARMPALNDGLATDLRFSRGGAANFSSLRLADFERPECPGWIPNWGYPRADLLGK